MNHKHVVGLIFINKCPLTSLKYSVCVQFSLFWLCVCVCVCSAERHSLLHSLFQEWIPGGLQELLNEMEGSGQEWWEGSRGGRRLYTVGGLSGSHLQAWLNNRMLYENKNITCLLKGQERTSNWLPPSLCVAARQWEKKNPLSCPGHKLRKIMRDTFSPSCSYALISTIGMYQHTDTKPTKKGCLFPLKGGLFLPESLDWVQYKQ